jgi:fimbrial chaperone protein
MTSLRLLGAFALCAAAMPAAASSFTIAPIRAELGTAHRSVALTLTNAGDEPVVVQVRVMAWSQPEGQERLDETHDVLASPAVAQIPGKASQIVRVALRGTPDADRELTYRLVVDEVPQAAPAAFNGVRVALRLTVPVFVAPVRGRAAADVHWDVKRLSDGEFEVYALNRGTAHVQVIDFNLRVGAATPLHANTGRYVLPGDRIVWHLKAESAVPPDGTIVIQGHSDKGEFNATVAAPGS